MASYYRFLITDPVPQLFACDLKESVAAPGKTICYNEDGTALVVEPQSAGGKIRPTRPDEHPDSPWCWADVCGDLLVYRTSPEDEPNHIVAFRIAEIGS
jgi:hypothetical protein